MNLGLVTLGWQVAQLVQQSSLSPASSWIHDVASLDKTLKVVPKCSAWHLSNNGFPKEINKVYHYHHYYHYPGVWGFSLKYIFYLLLFCYV